MFRLTAVLLVGLYAAMVIWGDAPEEVAVTRNETPSAAVPALGAAVAADQAAAEPVDQSDLSAREAVEAALEAGTAPAAEPAVAETARAEEPEESVDLWYVTGTRVNLRSGPSANAAIVGGVSIGDRAEVLSDPDASWIRIRTERGLEAWIFGRFLSETPA